MATTTNNNATGSGTGRNPVVLLPNKGVAQVKSVLSGDTVVLLGRGNNNKKQKAPEVVFTFERVTAPRMASKANNNVDDPGAFPSREWLRSTCIGKNVSFETRKQGSTAGDRVYGLLFMPDPTNPNNRMNLAVESVRRGFATPKVFGDLESKQSDPNNNTTETAPTSDTTGTAEAGGAGGGENSIHDYERLLQEAFQQAKESNLGIHSLSPLIRSIKNAVDDFETMSLVQQSSKLSSGNTGIKCVIEYIFDGSRYRCLVTDPTMEQLQYASFTLILAGVSCPRIANPKSTSTSSDTTTAPTTTPMNEPFAEEARNFVEIRLLQREIHISLHGTDKSGLCAVGTVHHPKGNIGVELLKVGYGKVSDWTMRMMNPMDVPSFRIAENNAKRANLGVWHSYKPPELTGESEIHGIVLEVLTGDTLSILPNHITYDSESKLKKVSLASIRSPRLGNEKLGKEDEPYAIECKDRLRVLTVGKVVKVIIHYERDIPMGETSECRSFGTISIGKREDIGEVLITEGLASTQRHRDDDEKSARYDNLVAAEAIAKAAKKGIHSPTEYNKRSINDLTEPRKAKSYSGSLMRARGTLKAIVEYVFNGSRYKLLIPSENCHVVFALANLRCPQPSPPANNNSGSGGRGGGQVKAAEPFGDISKRYARSTILQRSTIEIKCFGVTMGGVITGQMFIGGNNQSQKKDFSIELLNLGYATIDPRKLEYGEVPKVLIEAQSNAERNRVGIWSLIQKEIAAKPSSNVKKSKEEVLKVQLSEIRNGTQFYYQIVNDPTAKAMEEHMYQFTKTHGITNGAPIGDIRNGKIVAAIFEKSWYRAKIIERMNNSSGSGGSGTRVKVLFVDHGNIDIVPISTHIRPLDMNLHTDRIPPIAKEGKLALINTRSLDEDDGLEAAQMFQRLAWNKSLTARKFCHDTNTGTHIIALYEMPSEGESINETLVSTGLAKVMKIKDMEESYGYAMDPTNLMNLSSVLISAQEMAKKRHLGMWRYGDVGDDDDDDDDEE